MGNTVPVWTNRPDVKVWLEAVNKTERLIKVAIALYAKDDEAAKRVAEEVKNQEMLILRHQGFEMPDGFNPVESVQKIDGSDYKVIMYWLMMSEWKKKTMGMGEKKAEGSSLCAGCTTECYEVAYGSSGCERIRGSG